MKQQNELAAGGARSRATGVKPVPVNCTNPERICKIRFLDNGKEVHGLQTGPFARHRERQARKSMPPPRWKTHP